MAGKYFGETIYLPQHKHVNVLDRSGLWKRSEYVNFSCSVVKAYFLSSTKKHQNKIVFKDIVCALMGNCTLLESFATVRRSSPDNIKKEIAFNLLEDLPLYKKYILVFAHFLLLKTKFRLSKSEIAKQNQDLSEKE